MRILLLAQWYEPIIGGEEIHVRSLAHALSRRGHEVVVAALAHPDREPVYADGPVEVHRLSASVQAVPWLFKDTARQSAPPFPDPNVARALRRLLKSRKFDVVHAHNWMVHSYIPVRERSIPLVLTLHDFSYICAKKVLLYQGAECRGPAVGKCIRCVSDHYGVVKGPPTLMGLWAMHPAIRKNVDCFISVSAAVEERNGVGRLAPSVVIPNFVPDDFATSSASSSAVSSRLPEGPFILFVGSLSRIKGVDLLVSAHAQLPPDIRPRLVLMGYTGTEVLEVVRNPPPGVTVITDEPRAAVAEACNRSLFVVVPSICAEAFGLVVVEAMSLGRPVIASAVGGLPEVIADGETGLLVRAGSVSSLVAAMARLLNHPSERDAMGSRARDHSRQFTEANVVPRIERLYATVVAGRRSRTQRPARTHFPHA